jgi:carbon storage regulator CsrA
MVGVFLGASFFSKHHPIGKGLPRMLVLSRKLNERIVFPSIDATVQILAVKPGVVRLGIEAPKAVSILRQEVLDNRRGNAPPPPPPPRPASTAQIRRFNQLVHSRLEIAAMGTALLRRQLELGHTAEALETLDKIEGEIQALQQRSDEETSKHSGQRPRRALVVEDDQSERELLASFLRLAGLDVAAVGDGTDALDYLHRQSPPDVVLVDMVMPRCDGPTTIRAIRQEPALAGLRIFGVSGYLPDEFGLETGAGGVNGWFRKPFDPEDLLRELNREAECPT